MKAAFFAGLLSVSLFAPVGPGAATFEDAMKHASLEYADRLKKASEELNRTRERIMKEQSPLLQEMRVAEDRIIAAEGGSSRLTTRHEEAATERRKLLKDIDTFRKNTTYMVTLAHDGLQALRDGLAPGEIQL